MQSATGWLSQISTSIRWLFRATLPLVALVSGCSSVASAIGVTHGAGGDDGTEGSTLKGLAPLALREVAFAELMGIGNGQRISRPDPTEAEVKTPIIAHSYADHVVLARKVFLPIVKDPIKSRELDKAHCEWTLREDHVVWTKTLGEALDAKKCEPRCGDSVMFWSPPARIAFAEMVLEGHPRRAELRNRMIEHIASTWTGEVHGIIYDKNSPEKTPRVVADAPLCTAKWSEDQGYGEPRAMSIMAYFYDTARPEQMRVRHLEDALWVLDKADMTAPGADRIRAYRAKLESVLPARKAQRDAVIAAHRAENPTVVTEQEVSHGSSYLWHRMCGPVIHHREIDNGVWIESDRTCVTVTVEYLTVCKEIETIYDRPQGSRRWEARGVTGNERDVPCP